MNKTSTDRKDYIGAKSWVLAVLLEFLLKLLGLGVDFWGERYPLSWLPEVWYLPRLL